MKETKGLKDEELIRDLRVYLHEAKKRNLDLGQVLVDILSSEQGKADLEYILAKALMGQVRREAVKGYVVAIELKDQSPFVSYKGDARAVIGLLATVGAEITRREDVGLFIAHLLGAALQAEDDFETLSPKN